MDKILRIDVSAEGGPKATTVPVGEYAGLGGRALTSAIISKEVPPLCHPLGSENKLVIAPGLLSGSASAMSGRISVGCKSPLTGGIKENRLFIWDGMQSHAEEIRIEKTPSCEACGGTGKKKKYGEKK